MTIITNKLMNHSFRFLAPVLVLPTLAMLGAAPARDVPLMRSAPETLVAEAPIWGANDAQDGYAYLPVTVHGHATTLLVDLTCTKCDINLGADAVAAAGIPEIKAATLDSMTIGTDVQHNLPITILTSLGPLPTPPNTPPIIGSVGVNFLTTHYDILYDFPHRRVRLYAMPAKKVAAEQAWLPDGFSPASCGPMISIPAGAGTFTGMQMKIDGHPVTGAIEMGPYIPKMNEAAFKLLGLPDKSSRVQLAEPGEVDGHPIVARVSGVEMMVGTKVFGTWDNEVLEEVDVQSLLPNNPPVMLMNLSMLRDVILFNSTSSQQVCIVKGQ
jgi:hypothetical protein